MFVQDDYRSGIVAARDYSTATNPDYKAVRHAVLITSQDEITGEYDVEHGGDMGGWVFWEHDPETIGVIISPGSPITASSLSQPARAIEPPGYMVPGNPEFPQEQRPDRDIGYWGQAVPCAIRENGAIPIHSKEGGVDVRFKAKTVKKTDFLNETALANQIKGVEECSIVNGAPLAKGYPTISVQTVNQDGYEILLYPSGNMLIIDEASTEGASTRVWKTDKNGFLDSSNKEAASLDSCWTIQRNEENAKIVALQGSKALQDEVGFGAIVLKEIDRNNTVVAMLASEKGGPLVGGSSDDPHTIATNKDGKKIVGAHLHTNANWIKDVNRDGPLAFSTTVFPQIGPEFGTAEVFLAFAPGTNNWRWFVELEQRNASIAKVRWDFTAEGDFSEGELVSEGANGTIIESGTPIWIDYILSRCARFDTAGDNTIFVVRIIAKDFVRQTQKRDLYVVDECFLDDGFPITHLQTLDLSKRLGSPMTDIFGKPWENPAQSRIKTSILGISSPNFVLFEIPKQWETSFQDYAFLEISDKSRGLDLLFSPIAPTPQRGLGDEFLATGIMESLELFTNGTSIANYRLKIA